MGQYQAAKTSLRPSEEAARADQTLLGMVLVRQVTPESVEVRTWVPATATHLVPSAEQAMARGVGMLLDTQVAPELVEIQISCGPTIPTVVPSAEQRTPPHKPTRAVLVNQCAPESCDQ